MTVDNDGNLTYGPGTNNTFGTYTYDTRNELTSAGGVTCAYDPAGNRTSMTNGSAVTAYMADPKTSRVLMRFKTVPSSNYVSYITSYYIYGNGLLYEIDVTLNTDGEIVNGEVECPCEVLSWATNTAYYHFDCRGSTVALTDGNGNPTDLIEYSPYGMTTFRYGTNDTQFLYNGRYGVQTDLNGLLYMRARYYNPYICRFLNPDPSGFAGGLNFYAFADGNPVSETDPFGLGSTTEVNVTPPLCATFNANVNVYPQQYLQNAGSPPYQQPPPSFDPSLPSTYTVQNLSDSDAARQIFQVGVIAGLAAAQMAFANYVGGYLLLDETTIAAETGAAEQGGLNLFKFGDSTSTTTSGWRNGDYFLNLPNQGSPAANWAQNSSALRSAMSEGNPIFDSYIDASTGQQIPTTGFLNAERNLLENHGWTFNPQTGAYHPPTVP